MHVGRGRDDGLHAGEHDAVGAPCGDAHVGIGAGLRVRSQAAIALGVGHGDADGQVALLHVLEVGAEARVILRVRRRVEPVGRLPQGIQAVHAEIAHGAAGFLAHQARVFELGEQVVARVVQRHKAVDRAVGGEAGSTRQRGVRGVQRVIVGHPDRVDAGSQARLVGNRLDGIPVDEHARPVAAQGFAVFCSVHQHGSTS